MKTTQKILAYLEIHGPSTVVELAANLDRTKAAVRELTTQLCAQNLIKKLPAALSEKPGRPAVRFCRVENIPNPLAKGLVTGLMQFTLKNHREGDKKDTLENEIVLHLLSDFHPSGSSSASRMNQAMMFLENIGIRAKWHATRSGPKIVVLQEGFTSLLNHAELSERITRAIIQRIKEKAVGLSPTA